MRNQVGKGPTLSAILLFRLSSFGISSIQCLVAGSRMASAVAKVKPEERKSTPQAQTMMGLCRCSAPTRLPSAPNSNRVMIRSDTWPHRPMSPPLILTWHSSSLPNETSIKVPEAPTATGYLRRGGLRTAAGTRPGWRRRVPSAPVALFHVDRISSRSSRNATRRTYCRTGPSGDACDGSGGNDDGGTRRRRRCGNAAVRCPFCAADDLRLSRTHLHQRQRRDRSRYPWGPTPAVR